MENLLTLICLVFYFRVEAGTNELADYRSYKYVNADHKNFLFNPGRNIELQCEVAHVVPNATVKWHKGGLLLNELENKRIRVVGSKLVINPTEYIDTGHYNCYTNHGILYGVQSFTIEVISIFHEFERNSVTFACQPGAEDRIVYRWYHENKLLTNDIRRHLTISYMTKSDAGNYKCVIIPGDHYAAVIKLFVHPKPQLRVLVQESTWIWEDQSVNLLCDVLNLEGPISYYTWYKDGIIIDGTESKIFHLYDASMDDTGNYSCEIEYSDRVFKSPELKITIKAEPQIRILVNETTSPWEDEFIDLLCDVSNLDDQVTYYKWYKDDIIIDVTESRIYHVYDASMYDTGNYTCEIEYMDMVFKSLELEITVRAIPNLHVVAQETTSPFIDEFFKLLCNVRNLDYPVAYYKWYKNGIILDDIESGIYNISDASMDDTGNYSCEIELFNMVFKSRDLIITVKTKPQLHVVVQESTLAWENESLNLSCDVSNLDDPVTYYIWYKDNKIIDIKTSRTYNVNDASVDDTGNYRCGIETLESIFISSELQITVKTKPRLRIIVHEGTVSPWRHKPFHLLCDVENLDDSVWLYKWYKDPNIIDHIESRNYNVSDASMDDTGNYICEIKYLGKVFTSPGLQITVQECDKNVPDSIALFYLIDTHGDSRRYLNRYKNFSFNVAQILTESYNSTVEVRMGMAIFDHHRYKRLMKFGKYERITGSAKKLLEQQIDKIMALNNSNIHLINMADAIEKSVAEFEEAQTDDQVNTKNILVVQQNSIGCDDCVESLQKNLNVALMRNVDVILVTPTEWLDIFNIIANKILYDQKDGLEGVSRPLLEMIRKLASSSCHNG